MTEEELTLPYEYVVTESPDGTFTTTIICKGFPTFEDAKYFTAMMDAMMSDDKMISFELH
jgi:hypothetical protein